MKEVKGNLWDYPADAIVITTNGTIKKDGSLVMGRGCAFEAKNRYNGIEFDLGESVKKYGNHVHVWGWLGRDGSDKDDHFLISFPVKYNWWEKADLDLIEKSANELVEYADRVKKEGLTPKSFVMPRPGCGNGRLNWKEVKPILEKYLDDRFHVITYD
jgi:hypothetical protein